MRPISLQILSLVTFTILAIFCSHSDGYHVPAETSNLSSEEEIDLSKRERRQVESFDDEYPTAVTQDSQEEAGFWDRVVKVALKLFSKFVEWLNS